MSETPFQTFISRLWGELWKKINTPNRKHSGQEVHYEKRMILVQVQELAESVFKDCAAMPPDLQEWHREGILKLQWDNRPPMTIKIDTTPKLKEYLLLVALPVVIMSLLFLWSISK